MIPYQEASQAMKRQNESSIKNPINAGLTAASFIGGGHILNRILPFLNKLIPVDIAVKGLTKVDPRFGKFFDTAAKRGSTADQAIQFIKNKFAPDEETPEPELASEERRQEALKQFNHQKKPRMVDELSQQFEQNYGQQTQNQQPNAQNTDQALLAALAKILEM